MLFRMKQRISVCFLLEGSADGICARGSIAGADVDLFSGAGVGAIVVYAVGYVAANAFVASAGLAGLFIGLHNKNSFRFKKTCGGLSAALLLFANTSRLIQENKNSFAANAQIVLYHKKGGGRCGAIRHRRQPLVLHHGKTDGHFWFTLDGLRG